jgi:uncharacterized repeat protein (TIGR04076 family)
LKPISRIQIAVVSKDGFCPKQLDVGQVFQVRDTPLCPFLYRSAVPYLQTLLDGGELKFMPDRDTAVALCPNPRGSVALELRTDRADPQPKITATIKRVDGTCPFGHTASEIPIPLHEAGFCYQAYHACFPELLKCAYGVSDQPALACPSCAGTVGFKIEMTE